MHDTVSAVQEHTLDEHVSILIDPFLEWKHILNFHVHYWQMIIYKISLWLDFKGGQVRIAKKVAKPAMVFFISSPLYFVYISQVIS